MASTVSRLDIQNDEVGNIKRLVSSVFNGRSSIGIDEGLSLASLHCGSLPVRVRSAVLNFKYNDDPGAIILSGIPIDYDIGPTPQAIERKSNETITRFDMIHLMFAALLGDVYTFASIQHGNLFNDVVPLLQNAAAPISSGFDNDFGLHTEDAFSPYSGEYLGLMCLRNPTMAPTTIASVRDTALSTEDLSILLQERFRIRHNIAHDRTAEGKRVAILFGGPRDPYLRLNANYPAADEGDDVAKRAYEEIIRQMNESIVDVVLAAGEFMYLNNRLVAHGRRKYQPSLDGNDRWLRRLYITTDLKKSRALRSHSNARVIGEH